MSIDDMYLEALDGQEVPTWEVMCFATTKDGKVRYHNGEPIPMYECESCQRLFIVVRDWDIQFCSKCYRKQYV